MEPYSNKQDYQGQDNAPAVDVIYPIYQGLPPPYSPSATTGYTADGQGYIGQTVVHPHRRLRVRPLIPQYWNIRVMSPITKSLKIFLSLSGLLYFLLGALGIGLQTTILVHSYSTYYTGFLPGVLLIFAGILMFIISLRPVYPLVALIRMYFILFGFCIFGFTLTTVNYALSTRCDDILQEFCDDNLAVDLKLGLLVVIILSFLQTVVNIIFTSSKHKEALARYDQIL